MDNDRENLPFNAAYMNDCESLLAAKKMGLDLNSPHPRSGHTPLQAACEVNAVEAIKFLLDDEVGVDPNARFTKISRVDDRIICNNCTAIMEVRSLEAAKLLMSFGADISLVDGDGRTAADFAAERELSDVVMYLRTSQ